MPLITLHTNVTLTDEKRTELLKALSQLAAESIGKPEQYVMATVASAAVLMSGQAGPAAFAEVRSIGGLNAEVNQQIARKLCQLLESRLGIPAPRVYINFTDVPAGDWGWNGDTFG